MELQHVGEALQRQMWQGQLQQAEDAPQLLRPVQQQPQGLSFQVKFSIYFIHT